MRKLRSSLAGTVIVALLGGLSGAVLAQTNDEEMLDPMRAGHFTGTWAGTFDAYYNDMDDGGRSGTEGSARAPMRV